MKIVHIDASYKSNSFLSSILMEGMSVRYYQNNFSNIHTAVVATRHVLTRVAKCIDVDGGIFENVLH
jgi:hypothetical protein